MMEDFYVPTDIQFKDDLRKEEIKLEELLNLLKNQEYEKLQKKLDRMEQESIDFHSMVSRGYREVLSGREEVIHIDGSASVEHIQNQIREELKKRIGKLS